MKFYKLVAAAALAVFVSSTANAAIVNVYDTRSAFRAASGSTAITEDFNSESVGASFVGTPLALNGFTLERTGTVLFGGEIEAGTGAFNIDGSNFANVQTATFLGDLVLNFAEPIFGFGLDLYDFNNEFGAGDPALRTTIWLDDAIEVSVTAEADASPFRFIGFTSDTSFTKISFVPNAGLEGDGFGIDNIEISAVPVPAAAWLFGSAILGMFGFSRRKTRV